MAVVAIPVLFNSYLAGAMSGLHVARQPILDAAGSLIQPADFARSVTVSENFATEEQATIFATSLPGSFVTALGGHPPRGLALNAYTARITSGR